MVVRVCSGGDGDDDGSSVVGCMSAAVVMAAVVEMVSCAMVTMAVGVDARHDGDDVDGAVVTKREMVVRCVAVAMGMMMARRRWAACRAASMAQRWLDMLRSVIRVWLVK
ncbi:hypothetical protein Tco_0173721 [Tanacetum coccineum]